MKRKQKKHTVPLEFVTDFGLSDAEELISQVNVTMEAKLAEIVERIFEKHIDAIMVTLQKTAVRETLEWVNQLNTEASCDCSSEVGILIVQMDDTETLVPVRIDLGHVLTGNMDDKDRHKWADWLDAHVKRLRA